ncbi:hypothetical protein SISSUDRAFT_1051953 [Sistotremastrum suecicum HHB10207 ss-3]|uniref:Uncharacterized protein n=1 Tax=Sistotremastrum suecicum HHB10207 ss-3 TaxID=1314776 RepID=A0A166A8B1_9AGAM|nr:hypothetical protein SISSUDRAFT_1051953 [Sistotremastrum suecicum HHB10207 ss-3]
MSEATLNLVFKAGDNSHFSFLLDSTRVTFTNGWGHQETALRIPLATRRYVASDSISSSHRQVLASESYVALAYSYVSRM